MLEFRENPAVTEVEVEVEVETRRGRGKGGGENENETGTGIYTPEYFFHLPRLVLVLVFIYK